MTLALQRGGRGGRRNKSYVEDRRGGRGRANTCCTTCYYSCKKEDERGTTHFWLYLSFPLAYSPARRFFFVFFFCCVYFSGKRNDVSLSLSSGFCLSRLRFTITATATATATTTPFPAILCPAPDAHEYFFFDIGCGGDWARAAHESSGSAPPPSSSHPTKTGLSFSSFLLFV